MIDKKRFKLAFKIAILFICLVLIIYFTPSALSKYESITSSVADSHIAFYLLDENYYRQGMKIEDIQPRSESYVYSFTVANFNANIRTEVALEYDLTIITTTNLPLQYELYINELPTANGATNKIVTDVTTTDTDLTYFRTMTTPKQEFGITNNQVNTYYLVVNFASTYMDYSYQDIMEYVEIVINSKQIV